jgi:hypothetical protein
MWPGDVWHLWPASHRHLWASILVVVALYVRNALADGGAALNRYRLAAEVGVLVAVNVLPASMHSLATVGVAPFLPRLATAACAASVPRYLRVLLSGSGLAGTALAHLFGLALLADRHRRAAVDAARSDSWRPVPRWITRAIAAARAAHVVAFGAFARLSAPVRRRKVSKPRADV